MWTATEDDMNIGTKVAPKGSTKNALTYGYVANQCDDETEVCVYWPEIKSYGVWPIKDLIKK